MSSESESTAYGELAETVKRNSSQQVLHFGLTFKELQDRATSVSKGESKSQLPTTCSPFAKDQRPVAYYYSFSKGVNGTPTEKKEIHNYKAGTDEYCISYELNNNSHGLCGFTLAQMLPQVKAMPGYKVRWCFNTALHAVRHGAFTHNKTRLNYFDEITADDYISQLSSRSDFDGINRDLGNVLELQTFSDFLPQKKLVFSPPFSFNEEDTSSVFPLYMCAHGDKVDATFSFVKDPQSLLVIAKIDDDNKDECTVIEPQPGKRYATFMESGEDVTKLSIPEGCAHYAYMCQDECNGNWCAASSDKEGRFASFFVNQAIPFASKNVTENSNAVTIDKIQSQYPITHVSWKAQLVGNQKRHIYSNYTSNPQPDFLDSLTPIAYSTISNGKVNLLEDCPSIITTRQNNRFYTRTSPRMPGIHLRSFGLRLNDSGIKPGFYFNNGSVGVKLQEQDYEVLNGNRAPFGEQFTVEVRAYARTEFHFTTFPKSDEERLTAEKSIILPVNRGN
jgi:hypothetical protein